MTHAAPGSADTTRRGWVLAGLMATMMLAAMDTNIVATAVPQIVGELGGLALVSWVFSIYVLVQTVTIPVYGKLADLFGRKPVLVIGTLVFLAGSAACSMAWDMVSLIAFRGLQGLGAGAVMATVNTLAGDLYSLEERARIQGWLASMWGMAAIAGPLLGGAFVDYATWRWIFLVNLPIGALALVLIGVFLHEHVDRRGARIDWAGAVLVLAALSALIFGVLQGGQAWAWGSTPSLAVFALAALALAALAWVERRAAEPIIPAWLWRNRVLSGANLAMVGMGLVMMAPSIYLPMLMQSVQGLGAIAAGLVLASLNIGWPLAASYSGRFYLRIGFRNTALLGASLLLLASLGFWLLPRPQPVWAVVLDHVALGAGLGFLNTSMMVGVQSVVGWERRGVVTSANMFARYLGQSLGAGMFGAIFNAVVASRLVQAPRSLGGQLPDNLDGMLQALHQAGTAAGVAAFLKDTIATATGTLYAGMAVAAFFMVLVLLTLPRRFAPLPATPAPAGSA